MNRYREKAARLGFGISLNIVDPVDFISKKIVRLREAYGLRYELKELAAIRQKIRIKFFRAARTGTQYERLRSAS